MKNHIVRISVDDNFGQFNNNWMSVSSVVLPKGIKSIQTVNYGSVSGIEAIVDENILNSINSWVVVNSLMNNDFDLVSSTQEEFKELMSRFGNFTIDEKDDECSLHFDIDNGYDLAYARFINNDSRGKEYNTMDIWFKNNPISNFFLKEERGMTIIDIGTFSKSYYVYSETDWWYFTDFLQKGPTIQEIRDIKINEILNEKSSVYLNLLRQLYFTSNYKKPSNSFLTSVYNFYEKNGFITERQAKAVMKEIW